MQPMSADDILVRQPDTNKRRCELLIDKLALTSLYSVDFNK